MSHWNELCRLHPRLEKKLSNEELKGILKFIDQQVFNESSHIISRLLYMEITSDNHRKQHAKSMENLSTQINQERYMSQEYRREFTSLLNSKRSSEARNKLRVQQKDEQLDSARCELEDKILAFEELDKKLQDKMEQNEKLKQQILKLEIICLKLVDEKEESMEISRLSDNILIMKYSINNKDKHIKNLQKQLEFVSQSQKTPCDGLNCQATRYFHECKAQLIAKCEETSILNFKIEEGKRKLKEQQKMIESQK